MRRRRRDLGITVGGLEALLRGLRVVVQVNQVVRHTRMLWQPLRHRLEHGRPLRLLGVGLVRDDADVFNVMA